LWVVSLRSILSPALEKWRLPMKKLMLAAMIVSFGAAVILPAIGTFDSAYAATKKADKKKDAVKEPAKEPGTKSNY
jgi:hypothetical protein